MKYIKYYEDIISDDFTHKYKDDDIKKYAIIKPLNPNLNNLLVIIEIMYLFDVNSEKFIAMKRLFKYDNKLIDFKNYEQRIEETYFKNYKSMVIFESDRLQDCKFQIEIISDTNKYNL